MAIPASPPPVGAASAGPGGVGADGRVLPVGVKATRAPGVGDTAGLRTFLAEYPDLAVGGLLLHGGDEILQLGEQIVAAPWWRVL